MYLRRFAAALLLAGVALATTAAPALAHAELESSNPADGASLAAVPQQIELKFGEAVTLPANPVDVTGPDGTKWTVGQATVAGAVVTAPVQPAGPAGQYTINYRVISEDGDQVSGSVRFTLTAAAGPTSASPAPTTTPPTTTTPTTTAQPPTTSAAATQPTGNSGGVPVWVWIVGALVLGGIGVVVALRMGRAEGSDRTGG